MPAEYPPPCVQEIPRMTGIACPRSQFLCLSTLHGLPTHTCHQGEDVCFFVTARSPCGEIHNPNTPGAGVRCISELLLHQMAGNLHGAESKSPTHLHAWRCTSFTNRRSRRKGRGGAGKKESTSGSPRRPSGGAGSSGCAKTINGLDGGRSWKLTTPLGDVLPTTKSNCAFFGKHASNTGVQR